MLDPRLASVTWKDVRQTFARLNRTLFNIIESIDPDKNFRLYKISYPFGTEILKKGVFYLPNKNNQLVPITDATINKRICSDLLYNLDSNPVCMSTKNNSEIYLEFNDIVIPYLKIQPGDLLGAWGVLDRFCSNDYSYHPASIWNMSAGTRSLFMLPKIGDKTFHKRLQQEYQIKTKAPKHLSDQWQTFKDIIAHHKAGNNWEFELICFSKKWFQYYQDPKWQHFYNYLLKLSWGSSDYLRNKSFWELIFSIIRREQKMSPSSYINDMLKHLHTIACGSALGFAPATCEADAPIKILQDCYVNGAYKLKDYVPIIMTPHRFDGKRPVYFSLYNITALEFSEKPTKRASLIQDITQLNHALETYNKGIKACEFELGHTEFYKKIMQTQFDCFYDGKTAIPSIRPIERIYKEDSSFCRALIKTTNSQFPQRGNFIRSCVRISKKK